MWSSTNHSFVRILWSGNSVNNTTVLELSIPKLVGVQIWSKTFKETIAFDLFTPKLVVVHILESKFWQDRTAFPRGKAVRRIHLFWAARNRKKERNLRKLITETGLGCCRRRIIKASSKVNDTQRDVSVLILYNENSNRIMQTNLLQI